MTSTRSRLATWRRYAAMTFAAALLVVAVPAPSAGDHEGAWPPDWRWDPVGWVMAKNHQTGNHICQVGESVKIRVFVKATQDPPFVLYHQGYKTTGWYNNGNAEKHSQETYDHTPDGWWFMGQGWWLVNSVTFPEGKIIGQANTNAWFDHDLPPPGTIWLFHQKRCV